MAFCIHNSAVPMLRKNEKQANNSRDLKYAYILTGVMYLLTGILGTMGLYYRPNIGTAKVIILIFF
jgi:hypothetical protein